MRFLSKAFKMKKITLLLVLGTLHFLVACNKKYTCKCTDGTAYTIVHSEEIEAENQTEAQSKCQLKGMECFID
jgi:hypothetical protein